MTDLSKSQQRRLATQCSGAGGALNLEDVIAALYACEINCSVSSFWDGGFDVALGDSMNGVTDQENFRTLSEAAEWLWRKAIERHANGRAALVAALRARQLAR